jgi:hypothetical protein
MIGYAPRFHFERGMAAIALYLEWAFGAQNRNPKPAVSDSGVTEAAAMAAE